MAPPVPIPNTPVKRRSADDSMTKGHAKVGHRQYPFSPSTGKTDKKPSRETRRAFLRLRVVADCLASPGHKERRGSTLRWQRPHAPCTAVVARLFEPGDVAHRCLQNTDHRLPGPRTQLFWPGLSEARYSRSLRQCAMVYRSLARSLGLRGGRIPHPPIAMQHAPVDFNLVPPLKT